MEAAAAKTDNGHLAPGEIFENMLQLKRLVHILKEF